MVNNVHKVKVEYNVIVEENCCDDGMKHNCNAGAAYSIHWSHYTFFD